MMCDATQGLNPTTAGHHSVDRAQQLVAASGRIALQVDHVPIAKATGRILASTLGEPAGGDSHRLEKGTLLAANHVPLLASLGRPTLAVFRRLRVGILTVGSDSVAPGVRPAQGQSYNLAGPMLASMLDSLGAQAFTAPHAGTSESSIGSTLDMLAAECSVVLIAGCMGGRQHEATRRVLQERGAALELCRVQMRPATSLGIATLGASLIVCLPARLTAGFMAFLLFVSPLIRRLQGRSQAFAPVYGCGVIGVDDKRRQRDEFVWGREAGGEFGATPVGIVVSGRTADAKGALATATGIVRLPEGDALADGATVGYYPFSKWLG